VGREQPRAESRRDGIRKGAELNCNQLDRLQNNFAAILVAAEKHKDVTKEAAEKGEDLAEHLSIEQWLKQQEKSVAGDLAKHVREHGCAN